MFQNRGLGIPNRWSLRGCKGLLPKRREPFPLVKEGEPRSGGVARSVSLVGRNIKNCSKSRRYLKRCSRSAPMAVTPFEQHGGKSRVDPVCYYPV
jgi:hypothetical protein